MVDIIVTGHGQFSEGLVSALELIAGPQESVQNVNFLESDSTELLNEKLSAALANTGSEVLILTDLQGGSPFKEAVMLKMQMPEKNIEVISGTNFPLLLMSTLTPADSALELAESLIQQGKEAIARYEYVEHVQVDSEDEDFEDGI
ncbi:MAG: PTS fructose transporter subunit IIA [Streptococcaceae bacterium]|jgi:PTS system N-acetylgalactosamine-specific IIA component|nr:PTS fructose transporter subunit IIA [Streptococcaceae bacterium]